MIKVLGFRTNWTFYQLHPMAGCLGSLYCFHSDSGSCEGLTRSKIAIF